MRSANRQPWVITSLNRKGGVGKTHVCWLIASVCQERGRRCLVVDLDPQANITASLRPHDDGGPTVEALFDPAGEPDVARLVRRTDWEWIDVVPSSPRLEPVLVGDPRAWEKAELHRSLAEGLSEVAAEYDFILCDCPPNLSLVSIAALTASDFCLIPLESAQWGALGTQHVVQAIERVRSRHNARLKLLGYLVSRFKGTRAYQQTYLEQLRRHFGDDAFETVIPDLASFEKAVTDRVPITLHSPRSHAATLARRLFDEIEARAERLAGLRRPAGGRRVRVAASPA